MKNVLPASRLFFQSLAVVALLVTVACGPRFQRYDQNVDAKKMLEEAPGPDVPTLETALVNSAKQAEKEEQFRKAAQYYVQVVDKDPKPEYQYALAENLRRSGGYPEALKLYNELLNNEEYRVQSLEGAGLTLMAQGEYERAGDHFSQVMEIDQGRWKTINAVGILFTIKQMYPEARQYFDEGVSLEPSNISIRNNMALMEALAQNYDQSLEILEQAQQMGGSKQDHEQIGMNQALVYAIKGDLANAERVASAYLTKSQLLNNMGYYAHLADDQNLARSYLNMALMQSPAFYEKAWNNLEVLSRLSTQAPGHTRN